MSNETTSAGPNNDNSVAEIRLIREEVRNQAKLIEIQLAEHDKRNDAILESVKDARDTVENRSHIFGVSLGSGLFIGVAVVLFLLYQSLEPVVEGVVSRAVDEIDWDDRIEGVVDLELQELVTSEAIAKAVDRDKIEAAIENAIETDDFQRRLRSRIDDAMGDAVRSSVEQMIVETGYFQETIRTQIDQQQNRLREALATIIPIEANDGNSLINQLSDSVSEFDKLGSGDYIRFGLYPYDDSMFVRVVIWWRADQPEGRRFWIQEVVLDGLDTTSQTAKVEAIEKYLGQEVLGRIGVKRVADENKMFVAGDFYVGESSKFETYSEASAAAIEAAAALLDECVGIEYPAKWKVRLNP